MSDRRAQQFEYHDGANWRSVVCQGRVAWALRHLINAGANGCTPITTPGPRWSDYVFKLRHTYGLAIETIDERHGGPFPGSHARYVLRSPVRVIEREMA